MEEIKSSRMAGVCVLAEAKRLKPLMKKWNREKFGIIAIQGEEILQSLSTLDAAEEAE